MANIETEFEDAQGWLVETTNNRGAQWTVIAIFRFEDDANAWALLQNQRGQSGSFRVRWGAMPLDFAEINRDTPRSWRSSGRRP